MSRWLSARGRSRVAPCGTCSGDVEFLEPALPCEDTLPTSSFCRLLGGDSHCRCADAVADLGCEASHEVNGFGEMDMSAECSRTCGLCGSDVGRPPLFQPQKDLCPLGHSFISETIEGDGITRTSHAQHDMTQSKPPATHSTYLLPMSKCLTIPCTLVIVYRKVRYVDMEQTSFA